MKGAMVVSSWSEVRENVKAPHEKAQGAKEERRNLMLLEIDTMQLHEDS